MPMDGLRTTRNILCCTLGSKLSSEALSGQVSLASDELELSSAQFCLLSLLHSLSRGDHPTSVFLVELSRQLRFPSHLRVWLEEDIRIDQEDAVRVFAKLARLEPPRHLISVLTGLASKYRVPEICKAQGFNVPARKDAMIQTNSHLQVHPRLSEDFKNKSTAAGEHKKTSSFMNYPQSPLNTAALRGNYAMLEEEIRSGADPEEKDGFYGNTGIHWAVKGDNVEALELYKKLGANMSVCNNSGWTLLHTAADSSCRRSLFWLLDNGADTEVKDNMQQTPLFKAAFNGHAIAAGILLDRGANINAIDSQLHSPLYLAVKRGHTILAKLLVERGADTKIYDDWGRNLLHIVVEKESLSLMGLLLEKSCEVNCEDNWGRTPLHNAVQASNVQAVTLFLNKGANVEAKERNGYTPLHEAVKGGDMKLVRVLLENGANPNSTAKDGTTPIQLAKGTMIKRMLMAKRM